MNQLFDTTIVAVSTPPGQGGIAIVRLSGKDAIEIGDKVWRGKRLKDCADHTVHLGELIKTTGETLDTAVATIFKGPHSFTGEDTVEFAIHGSPWVQKETVALLVEAGASPAGPGEFTQRAFIHGRLDLAQAEGVADMIASSSDMARRLAVRQMKGSLSKSLSELREEMITLASLLELELDFSEEDVEFADRSKLEEIADRVIAETEKMASTFRTGKALKDGVRVVIAGEPNVGKSTLLNLLLGEEKAIVSDIPGTTRDSIEDTAEIDGVLYRFIDTAGLRETRDRIERIGIDRTLENIRKADLILMLTDIDSYLEANSSANHFDPASLEGLEEIPRIDVVNKCDLCPADYENTDKDNIETEQNRMNPVFISAKEGAGIGCLKKALRTALHHEIDPRNEQIITNVRHYEALRRTAESMHRFKTALQNQLPPDLLAQDLRESIDHISAITGQITTETLLQTIFQRFCIGK